MRRLSRSPAWTREILHPTGRYPTYRSFLSCSNVTTCDAYLFYQRLSLVSLLRDRHHPCPLGSSRCRRPVTTLLPWQPLIVSITRSSWYSCIDSVVLSWCRSYLIGLSLHLYADIRLLAAAAISTLCVHNIHLDAMTRRSWYDLLPSCLVSITGLSVEPVTRHQFITLKYRCRWHVGDILSLQLSQRSVATLFRWGGSLYYVNIKRF